MTTLESLQTDVDGLREVVHMADSDSVEVRQLLKSQVSLLNALRADQQGIADKLHAQSRTLEFQAQAIGGLIISVNGLEQNMRRLDKNQVRMNQRLKGVDKRLDRIDTRLDTMDTRQGRIDVNIEAIMHHLGIEPASS